MPLRSIKMRSKIFISCLVCMMLALSVQTWLFNRSSSQIIYTQAKQISHNSMDNLQEDLYNINKSVENSLIQIYNVSAYLRDISDQAPADVLIENHSQITYDLAHNAFIPDQNLAALYLYTVDNQLISSYQHAQTPIYLYPEDIYTDIPNRDVELIDAYIASTDRIMLLSSSYNENRQVQLIRYILKIYSNDNTCCGYLVADIDPKAFLTLIEKYQYDSNQIIWLQPSNDKVALVIGPWEKNKDFTAAANMIQSQDSESLIYDDKNGYELFFAQERKYNLTAYALYPESLLELNQQALFTNTLIVVCAIFILFFFLFLLISQSLTRPLTYVVSTMKRIKLGETSLRMKPLQDNEIGILGREFNDMLDKTQLLIKQEYASQLLLKDAKYKALQAQVNPHFLYNTLDTMNAIAKSQSCGIVATLCHALSNVFRYNLEVETPYATIQQEIVHLKNFMYIMNVRMNHSIEMEIHIDNELLDYAIPRLSIQPLVENSIQHGLKNKRGRKRIAVGAFEENNMLTLWVEDNGIGMDADKINAQMEHSLEKALSKNVSIGIDNINARVRLLFGDNYGVHVDSKKNEGSRVTLQLPIMTQKEIEHEREKD